MNHITTRFANVILILHKLPMYVHTYTTIHTYLANKKLKQDS